jgi:predicted RNase H-like HicB family nuclease
MQFLIRIYRYGGSYSALVPDLPGCIAAAGTVEEVRRLMAEAIGLHLEMMQESGEKIPRPRQSMKFTVDQSVEEELCTWVEVALPESVETGPGVR